MTGDNEGESAKVSAEVIVERWCSILVPSRDADALYTVYVVDRDRLVSLIESALQSRDERIRALQEEVERLTRECQRESDNAARMDKLWAEEETLHKTAESALSAARANLERLTLKCQRLRVAVRTTNKALETRRYQQDRKRLGHILATTERLQAEIMKLHPVGDYLWVKRADLERERAKREAAVWERDEAREALRRIKDLPRGRRPAITATDARKIARTALRASRQPATPAREEMSDGTSTKPASEVRVREDGEGAGGANPKVLGMHQEGATVAGSAPTEEPPRWLEGTWPADCVQRAFVDGAKWWQYAAHGCTAFAVERDEMEAEAVRRYGEPPSAPAPQVHTEACKSARLDGDVAPCICAPPSEPPAPVPGREKG
jgi:hypothetical protein